MKALLHQENWGRLGHKQGIKIPLSNIVYSKISFLSNFPFSVKVQQSLTSKNMFLLIKMYVAHVAEHAPHWNKTMIKIVNTKRIQLYLIGLRPRETSFAKD